MFCVLYDVTTLSSPLLQEQLMLVDNTEHMVSSTGSTDPGQLVDAQLFGQVELIAF